MIARAKATPTNRTELPLLEFEFGEMSISAGRLEQAIRSLRSAHAGFTATVGADHRVTHQTAARIAHAFDLVGNGAEAAKWQPVVD